MDAPYVACKLGFRAAAAAFCAMLGFVVAQALQLMHLIRFPLDEVLIYGFSLCIAVPFLLAFLALHYVVPAAQRIWSHIALLFAVVYLVFVTANYTVQLATVIPLTLKGAAADVKLLAQTPHSMFWDFDAIGYLIMGFVTAFASPVFGSEGYQRRTKRAFVLHAFMTPLIGFVYFYPHFSERLLLLALPWGITAPLSMLLLANYFRKGLAFRKSLFGMQQTRRNRPRIVNPEDN